MSADQLIPAPQPEPTHLIVAQSHPLVHMHGRDRRFHLHPGDSREHPGENTGTEDEIELDLDHFRLAGYITVQETVLPHEPSLAYPMHALSCLACGALVTPADQKLHVVHDERITRLEERYEVLRNAIITAVMLKGGATAAGRPAAEILDDQDVQLLGMNGAGTERITSG